MQKSIPKEKVVQIYEKLFAGQDITSGRAEFWDEFFLLRVNIKVLLSYFDKVPQSHIIDLKPHLSRLYEECMRKALNTNHGQCIANAIQTADCLMLGVFHSKNITLSPADKLQFLVPSDRLALANGEYMRLCTTSFVDDWPLLQELVINSLTIRCALLNQVNENPLFEWLMDTSLFELLGTLLSDSCLRRRFSVGACRLLGLISQYRWKEINNPFLMKLAHVKDEILLNSISAEISFAISESTRKYNEYVHSNGFFSSISNILGGRKVGGHWLDFSAHDGMLLCLFVIALHNPCFPSLLSCSHTHSPTDTYHGNSADFNSGFSQDKTKDTGEANSAIDNYALSLSTVSPRNLMADLIEYASVVMQNSACMNTCNLCFKIMSEATKNRSVCCFLHEYNIHFTIQLHRARLRHRKTAVSLLDRSSTNTMAVVLLDLLVEFFCTHLMKAFPFEIYRQCLDICYHLLSHQKEHSIRLDYDWKQVWKSFFDLMTFITKPDGPGICEETFATLLRVVGIFNFFITFGDCFLLGPSTYDDLYYELIRMNDAVELVVQFADRHSSESEGSWEALATELRDSLTNLEVIVKHFKEKISAYITTGSIISLTEAQVLEIIQANYESLNLRVYDNLHKIYEQAMVRGDQIDDVMLAEVVESVRRSCLNSAISYQSRFAELDRFA